MIFPVKIIPIISFTFGIHCYMTFWNTFRSMLKKCKLKLGWRIWKHRSFICSNCINDAWFSRKMSALGEKRSSVSNENSYRNMKNRRKLGKFIRFCQNWQFTNYYMRKRASKFIFLSNEIAKDHVLAKTSILLKFCVFQKKISAFY